LDKIRECNIAHIILEVEQMKKKIILTIALYEFFTWHIMNITGKMSIHNSIEFAFPEFYIELVTSLIMIFAYFFIDKIVKE